MSRKSPSPFEQAQLQVGCSRCGARPLDWCRAAHGYAAHLHTPRWWIIWPIVKPIVNDYESRLSRRVLAS